MESDFYDEYARIQDVHWWFAGRRRILDALLSQHLGAHPSEDRKILDIGCGTGTNLPVLRTFGRVTGVDTEAAAVAVCQERGWDVRCVEGTSLPFGDRKFDLITMLDVIEHAPDDLDVLGEAKRVLSEDGTVLVTVPAYQWMWGSQDEIAHHYRRYTRASLLNSLMQAGFEPGYSTYFNTLLFPPIAITRLLRRLSKPPLESRSDFEMTKPGALNALLASIFGSESRVLQHVRLPFGVSVLAFAGGRPEPTGRTGIAPGV